MTKPIPRFAIIVGAMKSGTTYLFSLLEQHPEVAGCKIKEPEYFVKNDYDNNAIEKYYELWEFDYAKHKVAIEASTSYTKIPQFTSPAERIKQSGIKTKIIYIMRHPVERICSQIKISNHFGWKVFNEDGKINIDTISVSKYYLQISEYYKRFPREDILLLSFESFTQNPNETLTKICKFLDIDPSFKFKLKEGSLHKSTIYLYKDNYITRGLFGIFSHKEYLALLKENKMRAKLLLWYLKVSGKLSRSQKRSINNEIKEDIEKIKTVLGFDTSIWKL
jgi:hypothetical protein